VKTVWVKAVPYKKALVTTALEGGAHGVWVEKGMAPKVKELGLVDVAAEDGDLKPGEQFDVVKIASKEDEERALSLSRTRPVIVEADDWKVIPLENLVSQSDKIWTVVRDQDELTMALGVLEIGVAGVVIDNQNPAVVKSMIESVMNQAQKVPLEAAEITRVTPLGMGDRVCVDTCTMMGLGEGMLVGNSSSGMFLVHAESVENPYVSPRPFRVNAGAVHMYTLLPNGKTTYLSELSSGETVLVTRHNGEASPAIVGRIKQERRPMLLVEAKAGDQKISAVLQNAETIRLTSPEGEPVSVVKLKPGTKVLVRTEKGGRHFGVAITETISER